MNKLSLKLDVLEALDGIGAMGMSTRTLTNQVQIVSSPAPTSTEILEALRNLEADQHVVSVRDNLDEHILIWTITNSGKAQLRARGR